VPNSWPYSRKTSSPWSGGFTNLANVVWRSSASENATRRFLAEQFFSIYPVDVLFLEMTETALSEAGGVLKQTKEPVVLHDADLRQLLEAVLRRNPEVVLSGIEGTASQFGARKQLGKGSREESIYANLSSQLSAGKRHVALLGAFHCRARNDWLFARLQTDASASTKMLIVRVIGEHQVGPVEGFMTLLHGLGVSQGDVVIPDPSRLQVVKYPWFLPLTRSFEDFQTVVVFEEH
jgi:hypothetical protein